MTIRLLVLGVLIVTCTAVCAQDGDVQLCEPWWSEYAGEDATGEDTIGLWQFNADAENQDSSGHGHDGELKGATISPDGLLGSCLESYEGYGKDDRLHALSVRSNPALSPQGAFTIEMWLKPKPDFEKCPFSIIIDKKYVANDDYQLSLGRASGGQRPVQANLGFGDSSSVFSSDPVRFEPGTWYHLAFVYNGAGVASFFLNGSPIGGGEVEGRRSIHPGGRALTIGDRGGSNYRGFPGYIDQVRFTRGAREFRRAKFELTSPRWVFIRMEKAPPLQFAVTNLQPAELIAAIARISVPHGGATEEFVRGLGPGEQATLEFALDTSLRPDTYNINAELEIAGDVPYTLAESFDATIVSRPLPHVMPVIMWGGGQEEVIKELGFTHMARVKVDYNEVLEAGEPVARTNKHRAELLNNMMKLGLNSYVSLDPGRRVRHREEFQKVNREGKFYEEDGKRDACGHIPELQQYCYDVGASMAQSYGEFPNFNAAVIHSEVRGNKRLSFREIERKAFRDHAGFDIPEGLETNRGQHYSDTEGFPESRVIPDEYPFYVYLKWLWKDGDGWNYLHSAVDAGLKSTGRTDFWTWHDPAIRIPKVYGSGGKVDYISAWTYTYPDPPKIGFNTDELLAMAAGADHPQGVMKMTQAIWYRSATAPVSEESQEKLAKQSVWEDTDPDARFITIAPMHLREALWFKLSRPIKGIMYHGWGSLIDVKPPGSYRYTNPETQHELARLTHNIVKPLGPTLLQVPGAKSDVAFLESFASEMFAGRGTWGWGGNWAADVYLVLQWAQLQPEVVFDETIVERGLDDFKVLVMVDCDVITQKMADEIQAFQRRGGIIIGDENTCPAITPNILIARENGRTGNAEEGKAALQELAAKLRQDLDAKYTRYVDSANPDVITYHRRYGSTDYVFAINDHREFGTYVGHHGLVMENGLPSDAVITVNRPGGFVYDLVNSQPAPATAGDGKLRIEAQLEPCSGRLFMITDQEIGEVRINGPEQAAAGKSAVFRVTVVGKDGKPLDAVVPVKVEIADPGGRIAEFSGSYGAVGGVQRVTCDFARNDTPGVWTMGVRESASGKTAHAYIRLEPRNTEKEIE